MAGSDSTLVKPIRQKIPTMTESEEILWMGGPTSRSMFGRYLLSGVILATYLVFWWANVVDRPTGDGQVAFILKSSHIAADLTGVVGIFVTLLVVAKIVHFQNGPLSGKWTISWTLLSASAPILWTGIETGFSIAGIFSSDTSPIPAFSEGHYLLLGVIFSSSMLIISVIYQRSFTYAITDKRIHLIKKFLYVDASSQSIAYDRIENLIVDTTVIGRILRFGTIQILTASGLNVGSESTSGSIGVVTDPSPQDNGSGGNKILSRVGLLISYKRSRPRTVNTPESCIYGVHSPESIHQLINQASDAFKQGGAS